MRPHSLLSVAEYTHREGQERVLRDGTFKPWVATLQPPAAVRGQDSEQVLQPVGASREAGTADADDGLHSKPGTAEK